MQSAKNGKNKIDPGGVIGQWTDLPQRKRRPNFQHFTTFISNFDVSTLHLDKYQPSCLASAETKLPLYNIISNFFHSLPFVLYHYYKSLPSYGRGVNSFYDVAVSHSLSVAVTRKTSIVCVTSRCRIVMTDQWTDDTLWLSAPSRQRLGTRVANFLNPDDPSPRQPWHKGTLTLWLNTWLREPKKYDFYQMSGMSFGYVMWQVLIGGWLDAVD